ncbi:ATP phosphoribosyltransferase regulatory subunit [Citrus sinensis]|nr:ATP phosphoribosyltransferase regulatory subunit [Citrus sinensis]
MPLILRSKYPLLTQQTTTILALVEFAVTAQSLQTPKLQPAIHVNDNFVEDPRNWNHAIAREFDDYDDDEDDEAEEEDRSLDLLVKFVENVFKKVSRKARKAVRSVLPQSISKNLVGFSVNGVLILAFLWVLKAFLENYPWLFKVDRICFVTGLGSFTILSSLWMSPSSESKRQLLRWSCGCIFSVVFISVATHDMHLMDGRGTVVCTLGTVVFVSILLIRGVWTGVTYLQESRTHRVDDLDAENPAWRGAQPAA